MSWKVVFTCSPDIGWVGAVVAAPGEHNRRHPHLPQHRRQQQGPGPQHKENISELSINEEGKNS